jgi:hypothetical protein
MFPAFGKPTALKPISRSPNPAIQARIVSGLRCVMFSIARRSGRSTFTRATREASNGTSSFKKDGVSPHEPGEPDQEHNENYCARVVTFRQL